MAKKTKIGIIGLGWPGLAHLKGYQANDNARVVALCDMNADLVHEHATQQGLEAHTDHKKMLKEADIDAVSVCLPNFLHTPVSLDALRAGKHVLCEKPPALNAQQARKMATAADARKLTLMYALCQRFAGENILAKDFIEKGELGDIYYGRAVYHRRRGIPGGSRAWFVDKKRSGGGALIDIGVHALDCAWWLMGTPSPVAVSGMAYGKFRHLGPKDATFDVDDSAFALIKFDNDATLQLECSWALNLPGGSAIQIAGTKGGATMSPLRIHTERDGVQIDIDPAVPAADAFASQTHHFVDCLQKNKTPIMSGEQGVQLMQMLDGIYQSSATGREVRIK